MISLCFLTDTGEIESFTQEIRLNTRLDGPWQFLVGAFYQDIENKQQQDFVFEGAPALDPFGGALLFASKLNEDIEQLSFFGEATFRTIRTTYRDGRYSPLRL